MKTKKLLAGTQRQSYLNGWFRTSAGTVAALLISLVLTENASAVIVIDPGEAGETFTSKTYNVTSGLRANGVRNANGRSYVLNFVFSEFEALRVNGDGEAITVKLDTTWRTNPSGIGRDYTLLGGGASLVAWKNEGEGFLGDADPDVDRPVFFSDPQDFDITGAVATGAFATYLTDFDGVQFNFRLPISAALGFPADIPEEELVLSNATITFASQPKSSGIPGAFAFSEYRVVSVPEPSTFAVSSIAMCGLGAVSRRRRQSGNGR